VPCQVTAQASTIAGSNADEKLVTFAQTISTTSNEVAKAITNMASATVSSHNQGTSGIISSAMELSQIELDTSLKMKKVLLDAELSNDANISENEYRSRNAVMSADDSKAEVDLILLALEEHSSLSVPEIIFTLTETIDKSPDGKVLVPIIDAECSEEDIKEKGHCSIAKKAFPGRKLKAFFNMCTKEKRILITKKVDIDARKSTVEHANKRTSQAIKTTNSVSAITSRIAKQKMLACTPSDYQAKLCGAGMTKEDYQEAIVIGGIVPDGDVSAANFSSPSYSSAEGYMDFSAGEDGDEETAKHMQEEIQKQALDRTELQDDENQKVVPLYNTYKNANQVKSAISFIDNIVAQDLIPNLDPKDRKKVQNAEYQGRYMARLSTLSMVRLAMTDSMNQRVGKKMREMINSGVMETTDKFDIAADSPDNKESVLGASSMDMLSFRVGGQMANMQMSDQNGESSSAGNDFIAAPSPQDVMSKILESTLLQNEMYLKEITMNEQILSLKSIALAQKANSPEMVKLMKRLRQRGR
jgi:hypothetical protein